MLAKVRKKSKIACALPFRGAAANHSAAPRPLAHQPASLHVSAIIMMQVQIPANVGPGMQFTALTPQGTPFYVVVPSGFGPGQMMTVQLPAAQPVQPQVVAAVPPPQQIIVAPPQQQILVAPMRSTPQYVVEEVQAVANVSSTVAKQRILPDSIDESELIVVNGCCCCNCALLFEGCLGCAAKTAVCCLELELVRHSGSASRRSRLNVSPPSRALTISHARCPGWIPSCHETVPPTAMSAQCCKLDVPALCCLCCAVRCVEPTTCIKVLLSSTRRYGRTRLASPTVTPRLMRCPNRSCSLGRARRSSAAA